MGLLPALYSVVNGTGRKKTSNEAMETNPFTAESRFTDIMENALLTLALLRGIYLVMMVDGGVGIRVVTILLWSGEAFLMM